MIPWFGKRELNSIKPVEVGEFFGLQADRYHLTTIRKMKICLNGIFETAIDNELCDKNPAKNIKPYSNLESKPKETYTNEEVVNILRLTDGHEFGVYVRILLELGIRNSEICGLRWDDINFRQKTISINRACTEVDGKPFIGKTKNKSSTRVLPMSDELCDRLKLHLNRATSEYITISPKSRSGLPYTPNKFVDRRYKPFFEDMRIERVLNPHECRHTFGTLMYEKTHDIHAVSKFMGHSSINITSKLYVHDNPETLRSALRIADKTYE